MLRVSVCTSILKNEKILEEIVNTCLLKNNIPYSLVTFRNGNCLIEYLTQKNEIDILFIENKLNNQDCKQVIYNLRTELNNQDIKVILISDIKNDLLKLFKFQLYDYLVKPIKASDINKILLEIYNKQKNNKEYFYYRSNGALVRSDLESILYFKSNNRKITLYKKNNVIEFYDRLNNVMDRIDGNSFWKVHQSYLININHAKKIVNNKVELDDGSMIPISSSYKDMVIKQRFK